MNLKNKLFAGFTALSVVVSSFAPAVNLVVKADSAEDAAAYEWAFDEGLTTMTSFNAFAFENAITREQAARFLVAGADALGIDLESDQTCAYKDLASADQSLVEFINEGCEMGIFKAQDNFNPKQTLTREQAELTVARILYGFDEVNDYAEDNNLSEYAAARDLLMADEVIKVEVAGQSAVRRGHLLLMLYRQSDASVVDPTAPVNPGHAEVSLVSSAATQDVPKDAVNVKVGTIKLTAGSNPTRVSAVDVSLDGLYNSTSINSNLSITLKSSSVVSREGTFAPSTKKANVRFSPALELAAGQSMNFDVFASLDGEQNETYTFKVTGVNVSNGTASGSPITLGTLRTSSAESNKYDFVIKNNYSTEAGDENKTVAEISFKPRDNAASLKSFVLGFTSTPSFDADEVFTNAKAYVGTTQVGTVSISKNKVIVNGLNINSNRNDTVKIIIKADVIHAGANITNYVFDSKESDIVVTEAGASYGLRSQNLTAGSNGTVKGYNLQLKKVALTTKEVAPDTNDVVLYEASYKAATDTYINGFTFKQVTTLTGGQLAALFDEDSFVLSVAGQEYQLNATDLNNGNDFDEADEEIFVPANTLVSVKLTADTEDAASIATAGADKVRFSFELDEVLDIEEDVIASLPNLVQGDTVTVKAGNAVVKNSTIAAPASQTLYSNEEFEIGRFSVDVKTQDLTLDEVTSVFTFTTVTGGAVNLFDLIDENENNITLSVLGGSELDADVDVTANTVEFTNINHNIKKDTVVNFVIKANLSDVTDSNGTKVKLNTVAGNMLNGTEDVALASHAVSNAKDYTVASQAPKVTFARVSDNKFAVTIVNLDSEADVEIEEIDARVRTLAADSDFVGTICLLDQGSSASVCSATIANTGAIGPVVTFDLDAPVELSANGGSITFELLIDSNFIEPEVLEGSVTRVQYDGVEEQYSVKATTTFAG